MFQTYDTPADPTLGAPRLARLRVEIARRGLAGFLVPRADEFQGEYVPPSAERLRWLTGFSGSAGAAVVLADEAALFVDGRYTLQAAAEADLTAFTLVDLVATPPQTWVASRLGAGDRLGFDPWLHTRAQIRRLAAALEPRGAELVAVDNLVDAIWDDRPAAPTGALSPQPLDLAGQSAAAKRTALSAHLTEIGADALLVVQPDSLAWAFNLRGRDVAHNPVPLAHAVVPRDGRPTLFVAPAKVDADLAATLRTELDLASPGDLLAALDALGAAGARVAIDPVWTPEILARRLEAAGAVLVEGDDPVILPKARKNAAEIAGARAAHVRDGAAMARFLAWFDAEGRFTDEIACAEKLEALRAEGGRLLDISFATIAAAGPDAALPHYHPTRAGNRAIDADGLFLIDSGGQYRDGTTDVTRTIAVGTPPAEMRRAFTLVLKGHIAIATARFPVGTTGAALDTLARIALWKAGHDFDHGTGHGVGSYLSVHEGPQRIAKSGTAALEPGMIVSNEPGFYAAGAFGIRIENLELVTPAEAIPGGDRPMLGFEVLTLVPIDRRLIDPALLAPEEIAWLDRYHARVRATILPLVDAVTAPWLIAATEPLA
ncbi:aminopeptidase P family protein [Siculibacillus lacustris]|uniref:Aminopeptidase P family protein n=1 Tax=Siculibacillus lacustris TaxID=1549641 RepID=A0A4Q9VRW7_9HYPH|nr:aminopeptidase P family protein [Siculibacillus lacustris]TBW38694.1 aminopeptidase P family protein [Siculibacillus lacustris]